jgi:hypothetical protein
MAFRASHYFDGRHVLTVVDTAEGRYLLDPYLLHTEAVLFDDGTPATARWSGDVPALPTRTGATGAPRDSRLVVGWSRDTGELQLRYERFSPARGRMVLTRYFKPNLKTASVPHVPPAQVIRPLLFHPEQNNLSVRVISRGTLEMRELIYPIALHHGTRVRTEHLLVRNEQGEIFRQSDTVAFGDITRRMAAAIGASTAELLDYVLGGARIYEAFAPAFVPFSPYVVQDE